MWRRLPPHSSRWLAKLWADQGAAGSGRARARRYARAACSGPSPFAGRTRTMPRSIVSSKKSSANIGSGASPEEITERPPRCWTAPVLYMIGVSESIPLAGGENMRRSV